MSDILWILSRFQLSDAIDILLVAVTFYAVLQLIRGTQAIQLLRGMIILIFLFVLLTSILRLTAFGWLIDHVLPALLVAIPVVFQPELRRALERLGRTGGWMDRPTRQAAANRAITQIANACRLLSEARHGALIVLERTTGLQDLADTGIKVNAEVTSQLLQTIFFPSGENHGPPS